MVLLGGQRPVAGLLLFLLLLLLPFHRGQSGGVRPEATSKKRSPHLIVRPTVRPFAALTHSLLLLLLFALGSSTTPGDDGQTDFCVNNFNH